VFNILSNVQIAPEPGKHLNLRQRVIREKMVAAIRLSNAFGGSSESWLIQQAQYDLWQVQGQEEKISKSVKEFRKAA
jgi:plasmid maintenance system antidote protein VapI